MCRECPTACAGHTGRIWPDGAAGAGAAARAAKLAVNDELREWVGQKLRKNCLPEEISHRLRAEFAGRAEMRVSHETIYQSLYVQGPALRRELAAHLRTGRSLRKPRRAGDGERRTSSRAW